MDLLFTNCTVLPMTGERESSPFEGAVGVVGNRLALVSGDGERIGRFRREHPALREIDASGKVLMPGLINTHCHVAMTLQRGYADDLSLMEWLHEHIWPFEAQQTPDEIVTGAELGIVEMLLGGVTSFVDMYWHENRIAEAVRRLGIRAMLGASYLDTNWDAFVEDLERMQRAAAGCERIRLAVAPHAPYSCSAESIVRGKELARTRGLHFMTHIAETEEELRIVAERYGGATPVAHLDALGVLDERTIGAHCIHVGEEDIRILAERGVAVSHNVQSNMKIASGIAPVAQMLRAGVCCTLGTDGCCSNNDLDMWEEMRTASFLQKVATMDPCALPAYEVLRMATAEGARALGLAGELGVIREGALADFILIDRRKPHLTPTYDLAANLVYCGKAADVDTVVVDGRVVVEGRTVVGLDLDALCARVRHTAESIAARARAAEK
ncbi:MAG: amidohydrolase [Alistipes sp.]|nr:amidohydrolase [Alistipes sp.]